MALFWIVTEPPAATIDNPLCRLPRLTTLVNATSSAAVIEMPDDFDPATVSPEMLTAAPPEPVIERRLKLVVASELGWIKSRADPGPVIETSSVMVGSAVVSAIDSVPAWIPKIAGSKTIASGPGLAFACVIASRSEPVPESAVLTTVNVVGTIRSSSGSSSSLAFGETCRRAIWVAVDRRMYDGI